MAARAPSRAPRHAEGTAASSACARVTRGRLAGRREAEPEATSAGRALSDCILQLHSPRPRAAGLHAECVQVLGTDLTVHGRPCSPGGPCLSCSSHTTRTAAHRHHHKGNKRQALPLASSRPPLVSAGHPAVPLSFPHLPQHPGDALAGARRQRSRPTRQSAGPVLLQAFSGIPSPWICRGAWHGAVIPPRAAREGAPASAAACRPPFPSAQNPVAFPGVTARPLAAGW